MRTIALSLLVGTIFLIYQDAAFAQNLFADYVRNVPRQYGPRDPWEVGLVMRYQMGHGGLFYNCDCEEHKRMSPYIRWEQQPTVCCPHGHCWMTRQQLNEIRQRIRTGACLQSEFCLCPRCRTSEPPVPSTCPGEFTCEGCPSCIERIESAAGSRGDTPVHVAGPNAWLGTLYQAD